VSVPLAASDLDAALREAALLLERGDAPAAAQAITAAARICAEAERCGRKLDPSSLSRALALWERCGRAGRRHQAALEASLLQLGVSRRAFGAYLLR
jgi:hypothetical protein